MQKFIVISLCTFAFFASHDVKSEDISPNRTEDVIEAPHCKDAIKINKLKFTRPGVIEKMKPFVIQEKNIKKTLIQDTPA
jgi:hypothetical protein